MEILYWIAVVIILITSTGILLSRDWRWSLFLLAGMHLGIFGLVIRSWPVGMAAVKLIIGWMGCAILGMTRLNKGIETPGETAWPQGFSFRILAAGLVVAVTATAAPALSHRLGGITLPVAWGGILAIGMGLVHLGMTSLPLRVVIALLTILVGFEVLYAVVETSILVSAMLASINIGLALVGAYLLNLSVPGEGN